MNISCLIPISTSVGRRRYYKYFGEMVLWGRGISKEIILLQWISTNLLEFFESILLFGTIDNESFASNMNRKVQK